LWGPGEGKNARKKPVLLHQWSSAEKILQRPGQGVGLNFLVRGPKK
jgi:hypothetical protein